MTLDMELKRWERMVREEEKRKFILNMAAMEMPIDLIAQLTNTTPEFVKDAIAKKDVDSDS